MALHRYTIPNSPCGYLPTMHTSFSGCKYTLAAFSGAKSYYAIGFHSSLPPRGYGHVRRGSWCRNRIRALSDKGRESVASESVVTVPEKSVSVILLAGGQGKRMGASMPKQYLPLIGQPIALHSFYTFSRMLEVKEIIIVCDPSYRDIFEEAGNSVTVNIKFALPGKERQDSVLSGLKEIDQATELACVHDSARPLVSSKDVEKVLQDAWVHGAAVLGVPVKATIKEASTDCFVVKTLNRQTLWEMQTPQVIKPDLLRKGFEVVQRKFGPHPKPSSKVLWSRIFGSKAAISSPIWGLQFGGFLTLKREAHFFRKDWEGLEVTDDVSIVEHLKHPVYITQGSYTNIKVTTPDDLLLAERILNQS